MSIDLCCIECPEDGADRTFHVNWSRMIGLETTLRRVGVSDELAAKPFNRSTAASPVLDEESEAATVPSDGPRVTSAECQEICERLRQLTHEQARDALLETRKLMVTLTDETEAREPADDDVRRWMKVVDDYARFCERSAQHGGFVSVG